PHENAGSNARDLTPARRALAIRDLERAITLEHRDSPQKADDHAELGRLLFASGQTAEALSAYDAALRIFPDDLQALPLPAPRPGPSGAGAFRRRASGVRCFLKARQTVGRPAGDPRPGPARAQRFQRRNQRLHRGTVADARIGRALEPPRLGLPALRSFQAGA